MLVDDIKPASLLSCMLLIISKLVVSTYKLFEYFHAYVFINKNFCEEININTNQFYVSRTTFLLYLPRERFKKYLFQSTIYAFQFTGFFSSLVVSY